MTHVSHRTLFLRHVAKTSPSALMLEIERAQGLYLYDTHGRRYMDMISGIAVSALGHSHPRVVEAVQQQAARYMHLMVYGEYVVRPQAQLAAWLAAHSAPQLNTVYFTSTGTEATEAALKLAKRYTGRTEIVACHHSYHGSTQGALSVMGNEYYKQAYRPLLPGITFIEHGSMQDLEHITPRTAAIIIEPIQGEAGVQQAPIAYYQALRERCTRTGTLLIADEIQSGIGRTGTWWAHEQLGFVPDILLTAKALGGGMPLGACISSAEILAAFQDRPVLGHISTFGGHAVSCAAGLAMLQTLEDEGHLEHVSAKAQQFTDRLQHPHIRTIRHRGLMMAVDLGSFERVMAVINHCMQHGLITDWFLHHNTSIRLAPPLNITPAEIDTACDILLAALDACD